MQQSNFSVFKSIIFQISEFVQHENDFIEEFRRKFTTQSTEYRLKWNLYKETRKVSNKTQMLKRSNQFVHRKVKRETKTSSQKLDYIPITLGAVMISVFLYGLLYVSQKTYNKIAIFKANHTNKTIAETKSVFIGDSFELSLNLILIVVVSLSALVLWTWLMLFNNRNETIIQMKRRKFFYKKCRSLSLKKNVHSKTKTNSLPTISKILKRKIPFNLRSKTKSFSKFRVRFNNSFSSVRVTQSTTFGTI